MQWSKTHGREKDKLIIRNVDNVCEYRESLAIMPTEVWAKKLMADVPAPKWATGPRFLTWLGGRMRAAWHPEAHSYVYAYTYTGREEIEEESERANRYVEAVLKHSQGRRDDWVDSCDLVKVGTSSSPEYRRKRHLPELYKMFADLDGAYRPNVRLLILPCLRGNAGEYLEAEILASLPDEDRFSGEWFHDTIGVSRVLAGWFQCSLATQGLK
jgi:hypothetical protein